MGTQQDILPYLGAADALVHPALYEPFGLVIAEAMASGLPVIASRTTGAARAMIHSKETGFVLDALAINEIADAMCQLADRPEAERQSSRQACVEAARGYGQRRMGDELLALYRRLLSGSENTTVP